MNELSRTIDEEIRSQRKGHSVEKVGKNDNFKKKRWQKYVFSKISEFSWIGFSAELPATEIETAMAHVDLCGFSITPASNPNAHLLHSIHWVGVDLFFF